MLYRKRVITLLFVVLSVFIFYLVLPRETKFTSLFSFPLVAFIRSSPYFLDISANWDHILEHIWSNVKGSLSFCLFSGTIMPQQRRGLSWGWRRRKFHFLVGSSYQPDRAPAGLPCLPKGLWARVWQRTTNEHVGNQVESVLLLMKLLKKALQKSNSKCKSSQFNLAFIFEQALLCQSLTQNVCVWGRWI